MLVVKNRGYLLSALAHGLALLLLLRLAPPAPPQRAWLELTIEEAPRRAEPSHSGPAKAASAATAPKAAPPRPRTARRSDPSPARAAEAPPRGTLDLRPGFVRDGSLFAGAGPRPPGAGGVGADPALTEGSESERRDLLYTESKVFDAFDRLAERINGRLEYPSLLAESGIEGQATLDLYFDRNGDVDEARSRALGGHRTLRGLLVRAARDGIVDWFANEARRIRKDQFRNQHFQADFVVSTDPRDIGGMSRTAAHAYSFLRKKRAPTCLGPSPVVPGALMLDFACMGMKVAGSVKRATSDEYRDRLERLKDQMDAFDELGLSGLNERIRAAREG